MSDEINEIGADDIIVSPSKQDLADCLNRLLNTSAVNLDDQEESDLEVYAEAREVLDAYWHAPSVYPYPTKNTCPTLAKCAEDEPIFVLRGQDVFAVSTILNWHARCTGGGVNEAKAQGALDIARAMQTWQTDHLPKIPD